MRPPSRSLLPWALGLAVASFPWSTAVFSIGSALTLLLWLAGGGRLRHLIRQPLFAPVCALVLFQFASCLWTHDPAESWSMAKGVWPALLLPVVAAALGSSAPRSHLAGLFLASCAAAGLLGILQSNGILLAWSDSARQPSGTSGIFPYSMSLVCAFYLGTLMQFSLSGSLRWAVLLATALCAAGVIANASIAANLSLVCGLLLVLLFHSDRRKLLPLVLVLAAAILPVSGTVLWERIGSMPEREWGASPVSSPAAPGAVPTTDPPFELPFGLQPGTRMKLWIAGWCLFLEHPLFGVGTGDYGADAAELWSSGRLGEYGLSKPAPYKHAHSMLFETLASRGLVGLLLLAWWIIAVLRAFWRLREEHRAEAAFGLLAVVLLLVMGLGHDVLGGRHIGLVSLTAGLLLPLAPRRPLGRSAAE